MINDQGTHFVNQLINKLTDEFQIQHQKMIAYHPQVNHFLETFNKVLENELTEISNVQKYYWDQKIHTVLWDYQTTYKKLLGQTLFRLVYGQEVVMMIEYIVPIVISQNKFILSRKNIIV